MMIDFDKYIDRTNTSSIKWCFPEHSLPPEQAAASPLPLWIADMDFQPPPAVIQSLKHAVETGVMGYSTPPKSYFDAVQNWQKKRFNWDTKAEWILQTPGVVTALNLAIQAFTQPGDSVLIQPPVYVHFSEDVLCNNRRVVTAPLDLDDKGCYTFNPSTFEAAIEKDTKLFILCNPHNPTGNVWTEKDLRTMAEICKRHDILVISDEIHEDLIFNQNIQHFTYGRLGEEFANNSIICTAPSKTFNIAGLQVSNIFIPNPDIRHAFTKQMARNGVNLVNYLGLIACEAAYADSEEWLEQLLVYIKGNQEYLRREFSEHLPQLKVTPSDSLYLAWVDFRSLNMSPAELMAFLTIKAKVWFDNGVKFSQEGHGFMRINVGCPRSTLTEAITRLKTAINQLK